MSPGDFAQWAAIWLLVAVFGLGILAATVAGIITGIGTVIEWFDKRGYTSTCPHCKHVRKRRRSRD